MFRTITPSKKYLYFVSHSKEDDWIIFHQCKLANSVHHNNYSGKYSSFYCSIFYYEYYPSYSIRKDLIKEIVELQEDYLKDGSKTWMSKSKEEALSEKKKLDEEDNRMCEKLGSPKENPKSFWAFWAKVFSREKWE